MKPLPLISIISVWLSEIGIVCAIFTFIGPLISGQIGLDWEFVMLIFGLSTIFIGGLGFTLGLIGNVKKHEQQQSAQKGFKYGVYSLLILVADVAGFVIYTFIIKGGGPY